MKARRFRWCCGAKFEARAMRGALQYRTLLDWMRPKALTQWYRAGPVSRAVAFARGEPSIYADAWHVRREEIDASRRCIKRVLKHLGIPF